ncbi:selenocysteine-specific translation elongation factor [bacterium]|nr:selenocysteine-specific translation elongation factor [bacterium]
MARTIIQILLARTFRFGKRGNMSDTGMHYVIVGTAGHIDHGKTELIRKLTGIDPDRLKEEKERGITIDLGFAYLDLPEGNRVGIVDVPGHERFIRNMLSGATGIDFVLLVIAADAGVMPQTIEHLHICQLLGIQAGLVVVTKSDLVDEDWLVLVMAEIELLVKGTFLEDAPILPVSSITGEGIPALIETLANMVPKLRTRFEPKNFRMPIDRSFTIKGFGTVLTGTILAGSISTGDFVSILPGESDSRVRTLQVHHDNVERAWAGQRVAVNVHGIEKQTVIRGHTLCAPDSFQTTMMLDARLIMLADAPHPLKYRSRVRFHCGTAEIMARVVPLESDQIEPGSSSLIQIRLEEPIVALTGDRFVLRSYSPLQTIAGGTIIHVTPPKRNNINEKDKSSLEILERAALPEQINTLVNMSGIKGSSINSLIRQLGYQREPILDQIKEAIAEKQLHSLDRDYTTVLDNENLEKLKASIFDHIKNYLEQNRLRSGISKEELRSSFTFLPVSVFNNVLEHLLRDGRIQQTGDKLCSIDHSVQMKPDERKLFDHITAILKSRQFEVPTMAELVDETGESRKKVDVMLKMMVESEQIIIVKPNLVFTRELMDEIITRIHDFFRSSSKLTVADVKNLFGYSRKFAIPLLEYLDAIAITERKEDYRQLHASRT